MSERGEFYILATIAIVGIIAICVMAFNQQDTLSGQAYGHISCAYWQGSETIVCYDWTNDVKCQYDKQASGRYSLVGCDRIFGERQVIVT